MFSILTLKHYIRDDAYMMSMKVVQFSRSSIPFTHLKQNPPLQIIVNQLKENTIQGKPFYVTGPSFRLACVFSISLLQFTHTSAFNV